MSMLFTTLSAHVIAIRPVVLEHFGTPCELREDDEPQEGFTDADDDRHRERDYCD